jgi:asparagine synthetase B (glutamine-hydrolysing)
MGDRGLLQRLNGMFAFCVYDAKTGGFYLARDRCGQKPLYYSQSSGRFLFASEVKALLQSAHVEARPNIRAIDPYLTLRNVPEPETMFAGVYTLPAAHYLHHAADGTSPSRGTGKSSCCRARGMTSGATTTISRSFRRCGTMRCACACAATCRSAPT